MRPGQGLGRGPGQSQSDPIKMCLVLRYVMLHTTRIRRALQATAFGWLVRTLLGCGAGFFERGNGTSTSGNLRYLE